MAVSRLPHRRFLTPQRVLLVCALTFVGYVGAFVALHKEYHVTFVLAHNGEYDGRFGAITVFYFSKDAKTNRRLRTFFFPLIYLVSGNRKLEDVVYDGWLEREHVGEWFYPEYIDWNQ